ncbi:PREDICTED: uncharacterized protein LOC108363714 [Rhagoletis zephyria]|uniref:uncharacterized protein LOC108363714 n=1 Tax=Rhagoletis zephyria TaxID=28612 RepID=UPI0008117822|nr:PREDICTED: uncharacterized protein LOC108363714 [Rhagoletis zephyria]
MFRQVRIVQRQWNLQRIFWRDSTNDPIGEYWLKVVTYGMTSSAFNAVRAAILCARDAAKDHSDASKVIENDLYMDDCATGSRNESEAIRFAKDIDHILKGGGFEMKKWKSNSKILVEEMRSEEEEPLFMFVDEEKASVLGLRWKVNQDQFTFMVKTPELEGVITKRKILGCVAQLYDPNGFISPVTILGKIIIQDLWRIGLDWDEPVPEEISIRFKNYWQDIGRLEEFTLDRWIATDIDKETETHGFSDASTMAYGAVIYIRVVQENGQVKITLLTSKTRVAPMKTITVPRLELAAAELLSRLLVYVIKEMEFTKVDYTLWTDSQVVLHWIKKIPRNLKTFVANKVASIQTNTDVKKWRYVNTKDNPADLLSRGMSPSENIHNHLWLQGPDWLSLTPQCVFLPNTVGEAEVEVRAFAVTEFVEPIRITTRANIYRVPLIEYVDKLNRAIDIVAYLFKFISNLKVHLAVRRSKRRETLHIVPDNDHRAQAMKYLLRQEQVQCYNN